MSQKITRRVKIPIGVKFIALVVAALLTTVVLVVFNATGMFKKDNLNNIYLSSDLLTEAKAGEARIWMASIFKRVQTMGLEFSGNQHPTEDLEREILAVKVFRGRTNKKTWANEKPLLAITGEANGDAAFRNTSTRFDKLEAGVADIQSILLSSGARVFLVGLPLKQTVSGSVVETVVAAVDPSELQKSFLDTGPYSITLIGDTGNVILSQDQNQAAGTVNWSENPIVQRMLTSPLAREFKEFRENKTDYLGAYSKLGLGGLGVVSRVEKSIALETSELLMRRSIFIALLVLSGVFILTYGLLETIVSPIRQLQDAAFEIGKGNFTTRVDVQSRDEMEDLSESFNTMTAEIGRKIENLSRINEACQTISATLQPQKLLEFSTDTLANLLKCGKAVSWYVGPGGSASNTAGAAAVRAEKNWKKALPKSVERALETGTAKDLPVRVRDGESDFLVIPIRDRRSAGGAIVLADKLGGKPFQDEDLFIAGTIASSVSTTFENINLLNETADKARMEKELETARHVQDTMFPPKHMEFGGVIVDSFYSPAAECGGDWWGCLDVGEGKILLAMGDATGHGAPAAMITATSKAVCSVLQEFAQKSQSLRNAPNMILHFLNKAVHESAQGKILMTFFAAVLDTVTGELTYANASHDPIYVYRGAFAEGGDPGTKDNLQILEGEPGPRLGQNEKAHYELYKTKLDTGDFMLLYTDGLPEGNNAEGEEYSDRKFMRSIVRHANKRPIDVVSSLVQDYKDFAQGTPARDDITLAVCKFNAA